MSRPIVFYSCMSLLLFRLWGRALRAGSTININGRVA